MSRSPFAARFTALVGQSPMSYLKHWRLQLATQLLQDRTLSLSDIAERVGYESTAAFSRIFKREFGTTAAKYRRRATVGGMTASAETHQIPSDTRADAGLETQRKTVSHVVDRPESASVHPRRA